MLKQVKLSADVLSTCFQHALATEKEEIMGLLIGEVDDDSSVVSIKASLILTRSDKKRDRVEISETQLIHATYFAEELATKLNKPLRVVGWYHSHPHITVWPSHVDLGTQAMYQRIDESFVGLIIAVYLTDQTTKAHEVQITCFQSVDTAYSQARREIPLTMVPGDPDLFSMCLETAYQIPKIFEDEENETFIKETAGSEGDFITAQHNQAVKTIALSHIAEKLTRPLLDDLTKKSQFSNLRLKSLHKYHTQLMDKLEEYDLI